MNGRQPWNCLPALMRQAGKKMAGGQKMRAKFYLNGKKITKKALQERIGEERLKRLVREAKETFMDDPLVQNDFFLGSEGMLTIEFY